MAVVVGCFGALIGSFLNVCIVRLPLGKSVVFPRSHCLFCDHTLAFWENIPLVSFLLLRGRCRSCQRRISLRYPLVELLSLLFSIGTWRHVGDFSLYLVSFLLFISPLLVIVFVDLAHLIIPDALSLPGIVVGLLSQLFFPSPPFHWDRFGDGLLGALLGSGILFLIAWGWQKLRHEEGMGGGDVKLAAMLGAFLGVKGIAFVLLFGSISGALVGFLVMVLLKKSSKAPIPFGPFLAGSGIAYFFFGHRIVTWYLGLF